MGDSRACNCNCSTKSHAAVEWRECQAQAIQAQSTCAALLVEEPTTHARCTPIRLDRCAPEPTEIRSNQGSPRAKWQERRDKLAAPKPSCGARGSNRQLRCSRGGCWSYWHYGRRRYGFHA